MVVHRSLIIVVLALTAWAVPVQMLPAAGQVFETRGATIAGLDAQPGSGIGTASSASTSVATAAPMAFSMVAFEAPAESQLWFRTSDRGRWGPWTYAPFLPDDEGPEVLAGPTAFTDALWVRAADRLQIEIANGDLEDVVVHLIDSTGVSRGLVERAAATLAPPSAQAATAPGIITRAEWGADESIRRGDPSYALPRMGIVHHTAGSNDYTRDESAAIVRGIYHYHVKVRGWSDIGYNLLIDKYGQVFEGRYGGVTRGVIGAHAAYHNTGSFGISVMGNFDTAPPPVAMMDALTRTIAWKFELHGINPRTDATIDYNGERLSTLGGHRDVGQTSCPGQNVYDMLDTLHSRLAAAIAPGWVPVTGDWDGDGIDTAAWFKDGRWRIVNEQAEGAATWDFQYGRAGDVAIVGDWNGDGRDTVGIVRGNAWYLRNSNTSGAADRSFDYGRPGDIPLPGNWDGKPGDEAGLIRDGTWHLNDRLGGGTAAWSFVYGRTTKGDLPMVGDWLGEGRDRVGIVRDGEWHLRYAYASGVSDHTFKYGRVLRGDLPVVGAWTADGGGDRPAIIRGSGWYLRNTLTSGPADAFVPVATPDAG